MREFLIRGRGMENIKIQLLRISCPIKGEGSGADMLFPA
jgi:hypothetical protein